MIKIICYYIETRFIFVRKKRLEINMMNQKLLYSWLSATSVMFVLSYFWHGYLLNDLDQVSQPIPVFLALAAVVYLVIGLAVAFVFQALNIEEKIITKGITFGVAVGFFLYLIAYVLGVSFKADGVEHIVIDFAWQMVETGAGGLVVAVISWHHVYKAKLLGQD